MKLIETFFFLFSSLFVFINLGLFVYEESQGYLVVIRWVISLIILILLVLRSSKIINALSKERSVLPLTFFIILFMVLSAHVLSPLIFIPSRYADFLVLGITILLTLTCLSVFYRSLSTDSLFNSLQLFILLVLAFSIVIVIVTSFSNAEEDRPLISNADECLGCHQVEPLSGSRKEKNEGEFRASHKMLNCINCHQVNNSQVLYLENEDLIGALANKLTIYLDREAHISQHQVSVGHVNQQCSSCHQMFEQENSNIRYSHKPALEHSEAQISDCLGCHFDNHHLLGGRLIEDVDLQVIRNFLRQDTLKLTLLEPRRKNPTQDLQAIREDLRTQIQTPVYAYLGETLELELILENTGAHRFPGGSLNHHPVWLSWDVRDASGESIVSLNIQSRNEISEYIYLLDDAVHPNEARRFSLSVKIPAWAKGPLLVLARAHYEIINYSSEEEGTFLFSEITRDTLLIPLRTRKEIE